MAMVKYNLEVYGIGRTQLRLPELIAEVEQKLISLNYSPSTVASYRRRWMDLLDFAEKTETECFTVKFGERYLLERCGVNVFSDNSTQGMPRWKVWESKRLVYILADYQNTGNIISRRRCPVQASVPLQFFDLSKHFEAVCISRNNLKGTLVQKMRIVLVFLLYLEQQGITDIAAISAADISNFIRTMIKLAQSSLSGNIANFRQFLQFLHRENYHARNLADSLPRLASGRANKLPTIWTPDEVARILAAVDRANPNGKRDYALLLLVASLGMREGDVRNLQFENFNWKESRIHFTQDKTRQVLELPLSTEVGLAIIDYLKFGRPKQALSPYIFVLHRAPYGQFQKLYNIMQKYLSKAMIALDGKTPHGLHSLRHTLATRLLEQRIPLPTISAILGHSSTHSTKPYLKVSLDSLRNCALEPEEVFKDE